MIGIALVGAIFARNGGYGSAADFADHFRILGILDGLDEEQMTRAVFVQVVVGGPYWMEHVSTPKLAIRYGWWDQYQALFSINKERLLIGTLGRLSAPECVREEMLRKTAT